MKGGRRIFRSVVLAKSQTAAVHALGNGDLRSLILYVRKPGMRGTEISDTITALCMCELLIRFLAKGKEIL